MLFCPSRDGAADHQVHTIHREHNETESIGKAKGETTIRVNTRGKENFTNRIATKGVYIITNTPSP